MRNKENVIISLILLLTSTLILAAVTHPANASTSNTLARPHVLRYTALGIGVAVIIAAGVILYMKRRRSNST
ncbi:MAG: hypothetical protein WA667_30455 [Candidatus Nitrosopolaris sp.]